MFTLAMIFLPQGVIILQPEIFTPLHWGKYIMALNFHLLKHITASNIRSSSRGENIIPSNIYPFHEVRILYCHSFSWDENRKVLNIYSFCLIITIALNAHLKAGHLMVRKSFMLYFCGIETKCLPLYTNFAKTSGDK